MPRLIEEGDVVNVCLNETGLLWRSDCKMDYSPMLIDGAIVKWTPSATGDMWHFLWIDPITHLEHEFAINPCSANFVGIERVEGPKEEQPKEEMGQVKRPPKNVFVFMGKDEWSRNLYRGKSGAMYVQVGEELYSMTEAGEPLSPLCPMSAIEIQTEGS